jgi:hypothetical protein
MRQVEDAARQARAEPSQLCCTVTRGKPGKEVARRSKEENYRKAVKCTWIMAGCDEWSG